MLGALFSLGVFSSANLSPKATPGSCEVFRTIAVVNLEGECQGLEPQYVAQFNGASYIQITALAEAPTGNAQRSLTAWVFVPVINAYNGIMGYGSSSTSSAFTAFAGGGTVCIDAWNSGNQGGGGDYLFAGTWEFIAATYDGTTLEGYMTNKGQLYPWVAGSGPLNTVAVSTTYPLYIGDRVGTPDLSGMISNVQLYNVTLSQAEITALYDEGIGGAPIDPQNLVGWWPLNGNAQDYSGYSNDGTATNVTYTSSWTSGYSRP